MKITYDSLLPSSAYTWTVRILEVNFLTTTSVDIENSLYCPHAVVCGCVLCDSLITAIIFLYRISCWCFIAETKRAYCAVRTESLNTGC